MRPMLLEKLSSKVPIFLKNNNKSNNTNFSTALRTPMSVFILLMLTAESIAITIMQGFVLYYHSLLFSYCEFSLQTIRIAQSDLISHGIYVITLIYQVFLYLDAVNQQNVFQLFMLLLFGFLAIIFTAIQTIQHMTFENAGCGFSSTMSNATNSTMTEISQKINIKSFVVISNNSGFYQDEIDDLVSTIKPLDYSMLVVIAICFLILLGGAFKLYRSFKWNNHLFHTLDTAMVDDTIQLKRLRKTLTAWAILTGFVKIDVFFLFIYAVQLTPLSLMGSSGVNRIPAFESIIVFGFCFVLFLLATFAIRNEDVKIMSVFGFVLLCLIGYLGFRLFTFGMSSRDVTNDPFKLTRYNLLFTTLTLTLLMIMTLCTCLVCIKNMVYRQQKIQDHFKCICPGCFSHSSRMATVASIEESSSSQEKACVVSSASI